MDTMYDDKCEWARMPSSKDSKLLYFTKNEVFSSKKEQRKIANTNEKKWGNKMINSNYNNKQWTTKLGEQLVKDALEKNGKTVWRPKCMGNMKPDWETNDAIWEVKTRNWTTSGTAGEKILGTPYKYANVPSLYGKPLKIVCVAFQEYEAIHMFGLFGGDKMTLGRQKQIDMWKTLDIEFIKFTSLING